MKIDWAEIYQTTYRELVRFLLRKVWDEDRAQDLAQEAFTRALSHQPANPRAWLFRVATNLARDEARLVVRRKRHLSLLRAETEALESAAPTPEGDLEQKERLQRLRRALETLSERDRDVLLLWDAGLSYAEISEQTDIAVTSVGTTLARARRRLVESHDAMENANVAHR